MLRFCRSLLGSLFFLFRLTYLTQATESTQTHDEAIKGGGMPNYLHQNPGYMSTNFIAGQVTSNFKGVTMRSVTIAKFLEV